MITLERGKENVVLGISALCEASVSLRLITLTLPPVIVFMNAIIALVKATDNVTIRGASVQKDEKLDMNDSLVRAWWTQPCLVDLLMVFTMKGAAFHLGLHLRAV